MPEFTSTQMFEPQQICFPQMPLAVYRELAAHLQQVTGIEVELLPPTSQTFDYQQSQVGGLTLRYSPQSLPSSPERVQQILAYYSQRYSPASGTYPFLPNQSVTLHDCD